jgi:LacI family transcriptional regulator
MTMQKGLQVTMMKRATMAEVARLANVGTMTVSRVLNNSGYVNPKTASRVHTAIERLGYRPNHMARALRGIKSKSIGLIVPSLADPFFAVCAHSVNAIAQMHGYSMILTTSNGNVNTEFSEAEWMLEKHVEGFVICPTPTKIPKLSAPQFQRTPIVSFDRPLQIPRVANVVVENSGGARRATEHLIEHGHKRIHFLGDAPDLYTIKTRFDGYRRALQSEGLTVRGDLEADSEEMVLDYVKKVMAEKKPPTAFFAGNNRISRYLYRAMFHLKLRIPEDIAIVGFDDFDTADMLHPPLTVVRQPVELMGKTAAEVLFAQLKMKADNRPEIGSKTTLKVELIVRSSCGCGVRPPSDAAGP